MSRGAFWWTRNAVHVFPEFAPRAFAFFFFFLKKCVFFVFVSSLSRSMLPCPPPTRGGSGSGRVRVGIGPRLFASWDPKPDFARQLSFFQVWKIPKWKSRDRD
jgi:hypothetical protein